MAEATQADIDEVGHRCRRLVLNAYDNSEDPDRVVSLDLGLIIIVWDCRDNLIRVEMKYNGSLRLNSTIGSWDFAIRRVPRKHWIHRLQVPRVLLFLRQYMLLDDLANV